MGTVRSDRQAHWRGVLGEQASSGLSVAAFCREQSISAPSFYAWRRKLRDAEASASAPQAGASGGQFLPVEIVPSKPTSLVRIVLPHGVSVEASSAIDQEALLHLVRSLGGCSPC